MTIQRIATAGLSTDPQDTELKITLRGSEECVQRVKALLALISLNGGWGHSGIFGISWDGDGADKLQIEGFDPAEFKDLAQALGDGGRSVEYVCEGGIGRTFSSKEGTSKTLYPPDRRDV